jgi:hypothetical protein
MKRDRHLPGSQDSYLLTSLFLNANSYLAPLHPGCENCGWTPSNHPPAKFTTTQRRNSTAYIQLRRSFFARETFSEYVRVSGQVEIASEQELFYRSGRVAAWLRRPSFL